MTKMSPIVFFGNEKLATGLPEAKPIVKEAIKAAGFEIEQVVTGPLTDLRLHTSKLAVLAAYGHLIPQRVLDEFPLGIINIHPSLLPKYRGSTPIETAILDGVNKTGVSIMQLTTGMDEGPIYKQKTLHLTGDETKAELTEVLQTLGAQLLIEVLPGIADGSLKPRQQPHVDRDVTYCKKITKEDGKIDWSKPAEQIEREIRAYAGWPGSRFMVDGIDIIVTQAKALPQTTKTVIPGKLDWNSKKDLLFITTINGTLQIERIKPANKREMSVADFLRGHTIIPDAQAA